MGQRQNKWQLVEKKGRRLGVLGSLMLAVLLLLAVASATEAQEVDLTVTLRGLRLNAQLQWQYVPLNGSFEVYCGQDKVGEITANLTQEQRNQGLLDVLRLPRETAQKGLALRSITESIPQNYQCDESIPLVYEEGGRLEASIFAYAKEGLFSLQNTLSETGGQAAGSSFAVLDKAGNSVLAFSTDDKGHYQSSAPLAAGSYTLRQTLAPFDTLPIEQDIGFEIIPYVGTEESMSRVEVQNASLPKENSRGGTITFTDIREAGNLYAGGQTAAVTISGMAEKGNTLPLNNYSVKIDGLSLLGSQGELLENQAGKEIKSVCVTPGTQGVHALVQAYGPDGSALGSQISLASGETLSLAGTGAESIQILYVNKAGEKKVPAGFDSGKIRLEVGLVQRKPSITEKSAAEVAVTVQPSWQYQYKDRDGKSLITIDAKGSTSTGEIHVGDGRTRLALFMLAGDEGQATLTVRHQDGPALQDAKLAIQLPLGWRAGKEDETSSIKAIYRGSESDLIILALSGALEAGQKITVTFPATPCAGNGIGTAWILNQTGSMATMDNPQGYVVMGEALEECPVADAALNLSQPGTYAKLNFTAENTSAAAVTLLVAGYPTEASGAILSSNADGALIWTLNHKAQDWAMLALPKGISLLAAEGQAFVTTDLYPQFASVWIEASSYQDDWKKVTAVALAGQSAKLMVSPGKLSGSAVFQMVTRTDGVENSSTLSVPVGTNDRSLHGVLFEDGNGNGKKDGAELGAEGQMLLLRGQSEEISGYLAYTRADGTFDFVGAEASFGEGTLLAQLPANTLLNGKTAVGSLYEVKEKASLSQKDEILVPYQKMCAILGKVFDETEGKGIAGSTVTLYKDGIMAASAVTDAEGAYRFDTLQTGFYSLSIQLPDEWSSMGSFSPAGSFGKILGNTATTSQINLPYGEEAEYLVPVRRYGAIAGQLQMPADSFIEGSVSLAQGNVVIASDDIDNAGFFEFTSLPEGLYTLTLTLPEGFCGDAGKGLQKGSLVWDVQIQPGAELDVPVTILKTGSMLLKISGTGLKDAPVTLTGVETQQGVLNDDGWCRFDDLLPGIYQAQAVLPGTVLMIEDEKTDWQLSMQKEGAAASIQAKVEDGKETSIPALSLTQAAGLSGRAWKDLDQDGIYSGKEAPFTGANVTLEHEIKGVWTALKTISTGMEGTYALSGVMPGTYRISVLLPDGRGFTKSGKDSFVDQNGVSASFVLESGMTKKNVDIGVVISSKLTAVSFWDSNDDGERGVYERSVEGTAVELLDQDGQTVIANGVTDKDGQAVFDGLIPGTYRVRFTLPEGYWLTTQGSGISDKASALKKADSRQGMTEEITLREGENVSVGAGGGRTGIISGKVWYDQDGDGIMEEQEGGQADCLITLTGKKYGYNYSLTTDETGFYTLEVRPDTYTMTVTGSTGMTFTRFSQTGGEKRSILTQEGSATGVRQYTIETGTRETEQNIGFIKQTILEGKAYLDANYNGLMDEGEEPLDQVTLELTKYANNAVLGRAITDRNGDFRFVGLRGGDYQVRAVLPDETLVFTRISDKGAAFENRFATRNSRKDATVDIKGVADGALMQLGLGAVKPGSLSGTVFVDENYNGTYENQENPFPNVTVVLMDSEGNEFTRAVTDENGSYTFTQLMPMTYTLQIGVPEGYHITMHGSGKMRSYIVSDEQQIGVTEGINLAMGQNITGIYAGLLLSGQMHGQVLADKNDDGLLSEGEGGFPGVIVSLIDFDGTVHSTVKTEEDGSFVFTGVMPGWHALRYELPENVIYASKTTGGSQISSKDRIASSDWLDMAMGEDKEAPLCGVVVLGAISGTAFHDRNGDGRIDQGEPLLTGVKINLQPQRAGLQATAVTTGTDGAFYLKDLHPDVYTLTVTLPEGMIITREAELSLLPSAQTNKASVEIALEMGQTMDGRLVGGVLPAGLQGFVWMDTDNDGRLGSEEKPISGLNVQLNDLVSGQVVASIRTDEQGIFAQYNMLPGTYDITISLPDRCVAADMAAGENLFSDAQSGTIACRSVELREGELLSDLRAGVREYTYIEGTAWADTAGVISPLSGVTAVLYNANDLNTVLQSITTGEDGKYQFNFLMPGEYVIAAQLPSEYLFVKPTDARLAKEESISIVTDMVSGICAPFSLRMGENRVKMDIGAVRTGKLGDFAWLDENKNGLQDTGEPGIPGLTVTLYQEGQAVASATTNEYGYYLFTGVYPTLSQVQVDMYNEIMPTLRREDYPILSSALNETQEGTASTGDVMVESNGKNFDCDIGFVLREGANRPAAIQPLPTQNWQ